MAVAHRFAHCRRALIRPRSEDQHVSVGPSTHVVVARSQGLQIDGQEPCSQLCVQRVDIQSCMFVTVNAKIATLVFRNCVPVTLKIDGSVEAVVYVGNLHPNGGVAMIESENPPDTTVLLPWRPQRVFPEVNTPKFILVGAARAGGHVAGAHSAVQDLIQCTSKRVVRGVYTGFKSLTFRHCEGFDGVTTTAPNLGLYACVVAGRASAGLFAVTDLTVMDCVLDGDPSFVRDVFIHLESADCRSVRMIGTRFGKVSVAIKWDVENGGTLEIEHCTTKLGSDIMAIARALTATETEVELMAMEEECSSG